MNLKCDLHLGVIQDPFMLHSLHIGKSNDQLIWRCQLTYTAHSAQIWRIFLPVCHWPFKKEAGCLIFQYVKNKVQTCPDEWLQASGTSVSFILLNRPFKWCVISLRQFGSKRKHVVFAINDIITKRSQLVLEFGTKQKKNQHSIVLSMCRNIPSRIFRNRRTLQ